MSCRIRSVEIDPLNQLAATKCEFLIMLQTNGADRQLTEEMREYLLAKGADLVGFGSVEWMEAAPEIMRPNRYLPDARTMISIGLAINEASCDLIARSAGEHICRRPTTPISCSP